MIHVITHIERTPKELIEQFRGIGTATVHEASGRKGAIDCAINPIARGVRLCGPAFTVQCHPGDNLMLHKGSVKGDDDEMDCQSEYENRGNHEAGGFTRRDALGRSPSHIEIPVEGSPARM